MVDRKLNITKASKYRYIVRIKNKHVGVYSSLTEACIERDKLRSMMEFNHKTSYKLVHGFTWRLEQAIWGCGMDLSEISRRSGVSRSLIWSYRFEGIMPNGYNLARLAGTMNVSSDWLLGLSKQREINGNKRSA